MAIRTIQTIEQLREYEIPEELLNRAVARWCADGLYEYITQENLEERVVSEQVINEKIVSPIIPN